MKNYENIELNSLPVYYGTYIIRKIKTYSDKVYTNFCGLNVPEDDIETEYFTITSIASSLIYKNKYYLQVCLDNCAYKIANNEMTMVVMI